MFLPPSRRPIAVVREACGGPDLAAQSFRGPAAAAAPMAHRIASPELARLVLDGEHQVMNVPPDSANARR